MDEWGPGGWVLIISAVSAGVTSAIGAWHARKASNKADVAAEKAEVVAGTAQVNTQKLDDIHHLTNGNLTRTQEELELFKKRNEHLERVIIEITSECPPGTLEKAKKNIEMKEAKIGKRRRNDLKREEDSK